MQEDNTLASTSFMDDDGVSFHGAIAESGRVVIDVADPVGEEDNTVRLLLTDLDQFADMLRQLRASYDAANGGHGPAAGEL